MSLDDLPSEVSKWAANSGRKLTEAEFDDLVATVRVAIADRKTYDLRSIVMTELNSPTAYPDAKTA
jgi:hypothetical protein